MGKAIPSRYNILRDYDIDAGFFLEVPSGLTCEERSVFFGQRLIQCNRIKEKNGVEKMYDVENQKIVDCKKCKSQRILIGYWGVGKLMFTCVDCHTIWYEQGELERYKPDGLVRERKIGLSDEEFKKFMNEWKEKNL